MTNASPNAVLAERLKRDAEANPTAYRVRLALLALFGDVALTVAQMLPIAAPIAIGVLWANITLFYWLGAAAVVFLTWLMRPQFRAAGRELTPQEAPALFAALDRLREKLDVPGRMEIFVDDAFNASAAEIPAFLGLVGRRRVLTLGMPLLVTLTRDQLLGVIAHELGHFSRRHGRFGHWLYRARAGWLNYARELDESTSPLEQIAAAFAERFVPYFSIRSFVYSRMCEYEADKDAALAAGAPTVADALASIAVLARIWHEGVPREMTRLQLARPEAPKDLYQQFASAAATWPEHMQQQWLKDALATPAGWIDTHPALAERLASLGEAARVSAAASPASNAGLALLGDAWAPLLAEFNTKWLRRVEPEWLVGHLRLTHIVQPLLEADPATVRTWTVQRRLAHARALRSMRPDEGLAALRALNAELPLDHSVRFALGAALLNEDDAAGITLLEALAKGDPPFRAPAYGRILAYLERRGESDRAELFGEHLRLGIGRRLDAVTTFWADALRGQAEPTSLPDEVRALLNIAIARDGRVTESWLMQGTVPLATAESATAAQLTVHGLVLMLDTTEMNRTETGEEDAAEHYERNLGLLVTPEHHAAVKTYLTTEPAPGFDDRLKFTP